jgi:hypothetical protein
LERIANLDVKIKLHEKELRFDISIKDSKRYCLKNLTLFFKIYLLKAFYA